MGIKGLSKLLADNAPRAFKEKDIKSYAGRKIAIDASMCMYQLLVGVRVGADNLTNDSGQNTSHIIGMFYRCIRLLELGIKPVIVFDGKPPAMKGGELMKRAAVKKAAREEMKKAEEAGDAEAVEKFARRINHITPEMTEACKKLVRLMGIPCVEAPCEAEAQCAELNKAGLVYATASEDMDSLTFATPRQVRNLWSGASSTAAKKGVLPREYNLNVILEDLDLDLPQFIDMCILCGCDYVDSIRGMGPVSAFSMIQEHKNIGSILTAIEGKSKYTVPDLFPFAEARKMFVEPEVTPAKDFDLKWTGPDVEGLTEFLVKENQFDEGRVQSGIKKLEAARKSNSQVRIDSFFKSVASPNAAKLAAKRKAAQEEKKKGKKRGSLGGGVSKPKGTARK